MLYLIDSVISERMFGSRHGSIKRSKLTTFEMKGVLSGVPFVAVQHPNGRWDMQEKLAVLRNLGVDTSLCIVTDTRVQLQPGDRCVLVSVAYVRKLQDNRYNFALWELAEQEVAA